MPLSVLDDYAETMIAPRIAIVNGVSQVQVQGASKYAVRVQIDPDKLHAQQIGINEVDQALQNWNVNMPTGQLFGPTSTYNIKAAGQLMNAAAFRPIVVAYRDGAPIRLEQVANVIDSIENVFNGSSFYSKDANGKPRVQRAITLQVLRQPGHQHHRSDRRGAGAAAGVRVAAAAVGAPLGPAGSLEEHPRGVHRHPAHDARDAGARRRA